MNRTLALIAAKATLGASLALGLLLTTPHATAHADPDTINLTAIADELGAIPACELEDGSDVIPTIAGRCIWSDGGDAWLTYADRSYLIVDDTTVR